MQKLILIISALLLYSANVYTQTDTIKITNKQVFFNSLKKFKLDSNDVAELYAKKTKQAFFYKMLDKIYNDDSLSNQQSFYALIFSFPEFSNLVPQYKKQKKEVFGKSTKYFREKINEWTFEKETFENELIMIEEQERKEQIKALEQKLYEEEIRKEIKKDSLVLNMDTTNIAAPELGNTDNNDLKKMEKRMELEERNRLKEEKKMLEEKKRMEVERKKMELEEEENKEN